jgi:uncharacterized protein (TIGR02444 family)
MTGTAMPTTDPHAPTRDATPFWRFSLALYGRPGVPPACLAMQDEAGVDVNVLLFVLYLADRGRRLAATDVARIAAMTAAWRADVVRPLRGVRRALKDHPAPFGGPTAEALRARVKRIELEAERIQQETIEAAFAADTIGVAEADRTVAARANIDACSAVTGPLPAGARDAILGAFVA